MIEDCSVCGKSFRIRSDKEELAEHRVKVGLPLYCSVNCKMEAQKRMSELDSLDAQGIKPSGYNPLK